MIGTITEIDGVKITDREELIEILSGKSPGEGINIKTRTENQTLNYEIILEEHPKKPGKAWLGIGFFERRSSGISGKIYSLLTMFKKPNVYYEPKFGGLSIFIYDLLWWTILISISVALVNMLPVGIFDGGRFFYLTVLSLTKSERKARKSFAFMTKLILFLVLLLMVFWLFSLF